MISKNNFFVKALPFFVFIFIAVGLLIRNLQFAHIPFFDWDEAMYSQIATELLKNKTLITTFNGHLWFDKPPFSHGLLAGIFLLFGRSEFFARLLFGFFGVGLIVMMYFLSKQILQRVFPTQLKKMTTLQKQCAYLLPVLVLASSTSFIERSSLINTDIIVAAAWIGYFLFRENFIIKSLFLLLGVFSKSVFGFYPLLIELFAIRKKDITLNNLLKVVVLIAIASFWYIYNYIQFGNTFVQAHFFDQVLKRIVVPIELHFGGKFYYFKYLWNYLGVLNLLFIPAYLYIISRVVKLILQKRFRITETDAWWHYLVLLSGLPFFAFLILVKTKLYWYLMILIPLLCLPLTYLFARLKNKILQYFLFLVIAGFFLFHFIPETYGLHLTNLRPSNKVALAQCLSNKPGKTIAFLTDEQEQKNRNFLEAAHYDTTASFYYGGAPAFVYYAQKPVEFFYDLNQFLSSFKKFDIVVIPAQSLEQIDQLKQNEALTVKIQQARTNGFCETKEWISFAN